LIGRATTATPCVRPGCMLHISRARSSARRISNEADLLALLARHGVETVYLEDMSYAEQVSLFARADLIIGAHGAGLAHLVNTRPGAWVVELLQTQGMYKQRIFQYLSELAGVNHLLIESATADTNGGGGNADMTADLEKLDALLLRYRQATVAFPV
jgi:capsular polysaccharide biosynthesis protein